MISKVDVIFQFSTHIIIIGLQISCNTYTYEKLTTLPLAIPFDFERRLLRSDIILYSYSAACICTAGNVNCGYVQNKNKIKI